jgi:hypothetical protein
MVLPFPAVDVTSTTAYRHNVDVSEIPTDSENVDDPFAPEKLSVSVEPYWSSLPP